MSKAEKAVAAEVEPTVDKPLRLEAVTLALQFHKNNGGMMNANQLLDNANKFLNFIEGNSNV
jgi:hypothetical protein